MKKKQMSPFEAWLLTRPACIQRLAKEFPIGLKINCGEESFYLLGYQENDSVILSVVNPTIDYEAANLEENKRYISAQHLRQE